MFEIFLFLLRSFLLIVSSMYFIWEITYFRLWKLRVLLTLELYIKKLPAKDILRMFWSYDTFIHSNSKLNIFVVSAERLWILEKLQIYIEEVQKWLWETERKEKATQRVLKQEGVFKNWKCIKAETIVGQLS